MRNISHILLFGLLFFMQTSLSEAAISISNGKWESTFDCPEWSQGEGLSCDGLMKAGDWTCSGGGGSADQITSSANHAGGAGGRGFRHWQGDGTNNNGGGLYVYFNSPQPELWIRYYHRYEAGYKWSSLNYDKLLYIYADSSEVIPEYKWANDIMIALQGGGTSPITQNKGWQYVMGGSASDGDWHAHEVHLKMDTNSSDGIGRYWIDGELVIDSTSVNYSGGRSANRNGWYRFRIGSNQTTPNNGRCMAVDYDDLVIYTSTPPNVDSNGYPYIGLIDGSGPGEPTEPPTEPEGVPAKETNLVSESFENNDWASRGWYDGTNSTGVASGGQAGNALRWSYGTGDTSPDTFGAIRQAFSATNEFLLEYYVKFDSDWRGSNRDYHPHYIYVASSEDSEYQGLARSNSMLYFESWASMSSPYTNYPVIGHQDMHRVDTSAGSVPNDLVNSTENRSANHCNTPYPMTGATSGMCYNDGQGWYSANVWRPANVSIPSNTWTKITAYVKMNTFTSGKGNFDGTMKLWVNDSLAINNTKMLYATGAHQNATWDKVVLAPWIGDGSPTNQSMWLDELSVWTVTSGGNGGSTIQPPEGFQIVQ